MRRRKQKKSKCKKAKKGFFAFLFGSFSGKKAKKKMCLKCKKRVRKSAMSVLAKKGASKCRKTMTVKNDKVSLVAGNAKDASISQVQEMKLPVRRRRTKTAGIVSATGSQSSSDLI